METTIISTPDNKPLFSIIMPCYNSEDYIDRSIQSCINQTFDNWELIIINDGSTDNTLNIINSYAVKDNRISVYSKENGGYVSAVNYGLNYVKGHYFMFLGSDDEISLSLFTNIFYHLKNIELPDFIGFRTLINKGGNITNDKNSEFENIAYEHNTDIKNFSSKYPKHSSIFFTRDTSKLYKTELLGSLRYFGKKGMDADGIFSMMFSHKASSFLCVPALGYIWYLRAESLSGRKKDYITQLDRIENWIQFGKELKSTNASLITPQEKYYLVNYFYSIVKSVYFSYRSECLNDKVSEKTSLFIKDIAAFWNITISNKEIVFFLKYPVLWKYLILPKIFFDKSLKRLNKALRK